MVIKLVLMTLLFVSAPFLMANTEDSAQSCSAIANEEKEATTLADEGPQLLIFVSFSMAKNSLAAWAEQARKAGGVLVLRGFKDNSPKATIQHLINTLGEYNADNIIIDPTYFEQFKITQVPAVVVTENAIQHCNEAGSKPQNHDVLYGDVGLKYALEHFKDKGEYRGAAFIFYTRYAS